MIVAAANDPELIAYAQSKGAKGINLGGICCTANEILMRQGVPPAGNFLQQELAIATGVVDAMIVDVQCIMEGLTKTSERYHTKIITTSPKARIKGALHIEFEEHDALPIAKQIVRAAIDNYPNRNGAAKIADFTSELIAGFSHEYLNYMQGGVYRQSFRPFNDAVMAGRIRRRPPRRGCAPPSRRGGRRRLQQPACHPRLGPLLHRQGADQERRARRADRVQRHHVGQVRPLDAGGDAVRRQGTARGMRGDRHPARHPYGLVRRQLPHPHRPLAGGDRGWPRRRHLRPARRRHCT
jgi:hypothetical protein